MVGIRVQAVQSLFEKYLNLKMTEGSPFQAVVGYAAKRKRTDASHFFTGFCDMGKTCEKSSERMASAIIRRTSEKAKLLRSTTECRRVGVVASLSA